MAKTRVLFVCIHNSGRSQMAEALLKSLAGDRFEAESAGLEPGTLSPVVVEALREIAIDISRNKTKSVFDLLASGKIYDYVVTVCDEAGAEKCPDFPGKAKRLHWGFPDPAGFQGSPLERLEQVRDLREKIRRKISVFVSPRRH